MAGLTTTPPPPAGKKPTTGINAIRAQAQSPLSILQNAPMTSGYTPAQGFGAANAAPSDSSGYTKPGGAANPMTMGTVRTSAEAMPQSTTPNVSVMAGAGPYNPAVRSLIESNKKQVNDIWSGDVAGNANAMESEYAKANQFAEQNSASGLTKLRDTLDRRLRDEANRRADNQAQNDFLEAERLRAADRAQQVADRNATYGQQTLQALIAQGAFGRYDEGGMGTDRSNVSLDALQQYMKAGGGTTSPGGLSTGMRASTVPNTTGAPTGTPSYLKPSAADTYWTQKRVNDLEGERLGLQNAQTAQEWARQDRAATQATAGASTGSGVRSNASGTAGAAPAQLPTSYDPTLYRQMLNELTQGQQAPVDIEMPAAPAPVQAPSAGSVDDSAAFGRARSRIGQGTSASLRSLRDAMTARGISGSGIEGRLTADVYGAGLGQLGEASRDSAIEQVKRDQDVADMGYQGALTQRSQDLSYGNNTVATRLANAQARQDYQNRNLAARQALQSMLLPVSLRY